MKKATEQADTQRTIEEIREAASFLLTCHDQLDAGTARGLPISVTEPEKDCRIALSLRDMETGPYLFDGDLYTDPVQVFGLKVWAVGDSPAAERLARLDWPLLRDLCAQLDCRVGDIAERLGAEGPFELARSGERAFLVGVKRWCNRLVGETNGSYEPITKALQWLNGQLPADFRISRKQLTGCCDRDEVRWRHPIAKKTGKPDNRRREVFMPDVLKLCERLRGEDPDALFDCEQEDMIDRYLEIKAQKAKGEDAIAQKRREGDERQLSS